jgi:hypothetical protein
MKKSTEIFRGALRSIAFDLLLGVAIFFICKKYAGFEEIQAKEFDQIARSLGSVIAQISITLAGFVLTSTAIFTAFSDKPLINAMYVSGHAAALISRMYISIFINLITCIIAIWLTIAPNITIDLFVLLLGFASSCLASLVNVLHKLWFVLNYVNHQDPLSDETYQNIDISPTSMKKPS